MKYYSLNNPSYIVDFREAVLMGQAPDKGLFFPVSIPELTQPFLSNWKNLSKEEIAFEVIRNFTGDSIDKNELFKIVSETVAFDFPLVRIGESIFTLELFHGPTAAFKDVGARFMSRCLRYFVRNNNKKITILVATSGDTGGAVADAFFDVEGIDVIILFPSKKVSKLQELQLTTYGKNIKALEIEGTFDDCQAMVKQAFADKDLQEAYRFSSANSINIARWLSQQFYYFYAVQQWPLASAPVISVPSGNFGNICAGLIAMRSGLPVDSFIAACNENDAFTQYIHSGNFMERKAIPTISNAMDVGNPSNFKRVLQVFDKDYQMLKEKVHSYSFTSGQTREAIKDVFESRNYLLDPHGAVGYLALKQYLKENPYKEGIFLETAHPAKFSDIVQPIAGEKLKLPDNAKQLNGKEQSSVKLAADYDVLKRNLLEAI